ncbi:MAG TPA: PrpF domain-containing protein [Candidatus Binataceae bacterium]|nr:PrpF domain-containing protein [Candidatus Binataceae bacterium]
MTQQKIPAIFMRGGTSKAILFHARDLPRERSQWDPIFLAALGSPDINGRQLDGLGGGLSSLSKVCVIGPPTRPDADVDYTFAQVAIRTASVDYSGNCGNMSSAVGPFAVDEGLVPALGGEAVVRIHNTNTRKIIVSRFAVESGHAAVDGNFVLPGVAGSGSPVRLDFLDPGGAGTGKLLPTGSPVDYLDVPGLGRVQASMVDAANPCVFVLADALGMSGTEMPDVLDADRELLTRLEAIRLAASLRMGIAASGEEAARKASIPKVAMVTGPRDAPTLSGERLSAETVDVTVRMISLEQPHRAVPLTGAMCLAVASRLKGSLVQSVTRPPQRMDDPVRIAQPSGLTVVGAMVRRENDAWHAEHATVYRTARRLMDGAVYVRTPELGEAKR